LSDNDVTSIVRQNDTIFWVTTFGGGLNRFDLSTESFTSYRSLIIDKSTLSSNDVLDAYIDSENLLWVTYWGGGIDKIDLKKEQVERFSKQHTLPSNIVTAIEEDNNGNIWFSTKKGICKYNKKTDKLSFYTNGFSASTNAYEIGHAAKDKQGNLFFGGEKGYMKIDANHVDSEIFNDYNIIISDFNIIGERAGHTDNSHINSMSNYSKENLPLILAHFENSLSFRFSFPYFSSKNRYYEVKMSGFDTEWREIGDNPEVTFTNLSPGKYTLQGRCHTGGGENYYFSRPISLLIKTPWWVSWWAFCLYLIVFISLLYLFFTYSSRWADIKGKLETERVLRVKENELNSLKQRFFTNISHEIRTPLTLIINSIDMLSNKLMLNKESKNSFYSIKKNANHLMHLVNEVLDFKKIEEGQQQLHLTEGDFINFCKEIIISFNDSAEKKNVQLTIESEIENQPLLFDKQQMEKVIYNLVSNAIKFTPSGGVVAIGFNKDDQYIYLTVKDSGVGIDAKDQEVIFKPFRQGKDQKLQQSVGFGLGLYITKTIVNQHAGEISLVSKPEEGSTFRVKIPIYSEYTNRNYKSNQSDFSEENIAFDEKEVEVFSFTDFSDRTILIVEDNLELMSYLSAVFSDYYHVLTAPNGSVGWDIAKTKIPDLIISDVMMPEVDGIAMTKKIKSDMRPSHIPIIILTARTSLIFKNEGYDTGADEYVTKPFNKSLLLTRVRNLLKNRQLVSQHIQKDIITAPSQLALSSKDEEFLKDLMQVIDENAINEDLSAKFIAHALGMSHSVIYKKIKSLTGMSIVEFIRDYKLKTAAKLITELGYSVADASFKVGFSDTKYFSRIFKRHFGVNPSKYNSSNLT
jgi:signal transduction histidine kinase/DNA-binding response OmpR family regulator